jgi:hypothetical protein
MAMKLLGLKQCNSTSNVSEGFVVDIRSSGSVLRPIHTQHAVPLPCCALIHTCHAAPLPCSDSAVSFVKVRVVAGNIRTASPTV